MITTQMLTVSGRFKNLARIADFISDIAGQAGLNDKATYAMQMAVDEACTNIIEHAYGGEGKGQIQIRCHIQTDGLQVTIFDWGTPFDPAQVPELDPTTPLADRKIRGMGLFFIYNLVDAVEFKFNTAEGNQLILFKRREESS
jgi:serine/threonine-protein kinase RsbW